MPDNQQGIVQGPAQKLCSTTASRGTQWVTPYSVSLQDFCMLQNVCPPLSCGKRSSSSCGSNRQIGKFMFVQNTFKRHSSYFQVTLQHLILPVATHASGAVVKLSCWTWAVLLGVFWLTLSLSPRDGAGKCRNCTLTQPGDNEPQTKLSYTNGSASSEPFPLQGSTS